MLSKNLTLICAPVPVLPRPAPLPGLGGVFGPMNSQAEPLARVFGMAPKGAGWVWAFDQKEKNRSSTKLVSLSMAVDF